MRSTATARILAVAALVVSVFGTHHAASPAHHGSHVVVSPGQPAPRVGPSYLYPDPETTPGVTNPQVPQANIQQTICVRGWTGTVRPPKSYTDNLKTQQLQAARYTDKIPAHYEEDHFISLELGGHPRDPKNLWPEMWGTPSQPLTSHGPFPPSIIGAKSKDKVENALKAAVCAGTLTLHEAQQRVNKGLGIAVPWSPSRRSRLSYPSSHGRPRSSPSRRSFVGSGERGSRSSSSKEIFRQVGRGRRGEAIPGHRELSIGNCPRGRASAGLLSRPLSLETKEPYGETHDEFAASVRAALPSERATCFVRRGPP